MSHENLPPDCELSNFEAILGSLTPVRSSVDRDQLMFEAGRASKRTSLGAWPIATGLCALVALGEAAWLANRPPRTVERVVVLYDQARTIPANVPEKVASGSPTLAEATSSEPGRLEAYPTNSAASEPDRLEAYPTGSASRLNRLPRTDYERLCWQVMRHGLDGLPESPRVEVRSRPSGADHSPATAESLLQSEMDRLLKPGGPT